MRRSDWTIENSFSHTKVEKQEDGTYKAYFPHHPEVQAGVHGSEAEAIRLAKLAFSEAHQSGKLGGTIS